MRNTDEALTDLLKSAIQSAIDTNKELISVSVTHTERSICYLSRNNEINGKCI